MTDNKETRVGHDRGEDGNGKRRRVLLILSLLVCIGAAVAAWLWYLSKVEVTTDDAFVDAPVHLVSARVAGQVVKVHPDDNRMVRAGELLVELDGAPFRARLARAEAQLELARNESSVDAAAADIAAAALRQAEAQAAQAGLDLQRGRALHAREVIPKERLEQLETAATVAGGSVQEARERLRKARASLGNAGSGTPALVAQRAAELELAALELSYTSVPAPADGYVTNRKVEVGNNIQPGQPLLSLVQLDAPWVVANYKERQLTHVEPGQRVTLTVDAYPGRSFTGHVDSIMAGTGAAFALLPPENATGNYVKVVQRIPVKILLDPDTDPAHLLRVGMSVVPTIHTGRSLGDIIGHLNPFD